MSGYQTWFFWPLPPLSHAILWVYSAYSFLYSLSFCLCFTYHCFPNFLCCFSHLCLLSLDNLNCFFGLKWWFLKPLSRVQFLIGITVWIYPNLNLTPKSLFFLWPYFCKVMVSEPGTNLTVSHLWLLLSSPIIVHKIFNSSYLHL